MESVEVLEQFIQLDPVQFQTLTDSMEVFAEQLKQISDIQIVILAFSGLGCGILLANIFSRYFRGSLWKS